MLTARKQAPSPLRDLDTPRAVLKPRMPRPKVPSAEMIPIPTATTSVKRPRIPSSSITVNLDPRVPHKALPQVVQKKVKLTVIGALSDTKVIPPVPVFSKPILGCMIEQPATLNARASDVAIPAEEECIKEYDATMTTMAIK